MPRGGAAPHRMAGEAEDKIGPAPVRAPLDALWSRAMPVPTDQERRVGPVATQLGEKPDQAQGIVRPGGACARAQISRDQRM
jgi:hypothetical protein